VRLGVNVPNFGPGTTPDSLLEWVRFAEIAGFSLAVMSDHVAPTPEVTALYPSPFYDPFATLAWLANQTDLSLGTSVTVVPYRHPLVIARLAANLDRFTGGRFVLGVGAGWAASEFEVIGVPFEQRGAITDEYLDVILAAWAAPEMSFDGDHVHFERVDTGPAPVGVPHPPLWVGGGGSVALERAARFGDAWHPSHLTCEELRRRIPDLRVACEEAGRPPDAVAVTSRRRIVLDDADAGDADRTLHGGPAQIAETIAELQDVGVTHLVVEIPGASEAELLEHLDWFAAEVLTRRA
jgi:probable F420-dependent oxidoreductase